MKPRNVLEREQRPRKRQVPGKQIENIKIENTKVSRSVTFGAGEWTRSSVSAVATATMGKHEQARRKQRW